MRAEIKDFIDNLIRAENIYNLSLSFNSFFEALNENPIFVPVCTKVESDYMIFAFGDYAEIKLTENCIIVTRTVDGEQLLNCYNIDEYETFINSSVASQIAEYMDKDNE